MAEAGKTVARNPTDNENPDPNSQQIPPPQALNLHEQVLEVIIGRHTERMGLILGLIGIATLSSGIGGYFARSAPGFFNNDITTYYKCLPPFIVVGVLEVLYGIWVSRNHPVRANKVAKTVLLLSIIPLLVARDFTGAGISL